MDNEQKEQGVIYILTNPSFPDYVKIGYADDIDKRLAQLNRSECVPFAFRVYAIYGVQSRLSDIELHKIIDNLNPNLRAIENFEGKKRVREFYAMSAEDAYALLEGIAKITGSTKRLKKVAPNKAEREAEELAEEIETESHERRENFSFAKCGIPVGAELTFSHDPSILCTVADERRVSYHGEMRSMSGLARELLGSKGPVQGTLYFTYEGELLTDRRNRLERENKERK